MGLEMTQVALGVAFVAVWAFVGHVVVRGNKTMP
jgi:hypothetical protein